MGWVNFSMHSLTKGDFTFSGLDIRYTADFLVNTNPSLAGNLSNALNQQMTAGTGTLTVPLQFNTSADGVLSSKTRPSPTWTAHPTLRFHLRPCSTFGRTTRPVVIDWQPITDFGDDLLDFAIYRSPAGQAVDLQTSTQRLWRTTPSTSLSNPVNLGPIGCRASIGLVSPATSQPR